MSLVLWFHCDSASGIVISAWVSNPLPPHSHPCAAQGTQRWAQVWVTEMNGNHSPPAFLKAKHILYILCTEKYFFFFFLECLQKFRQKKADSSGAFQQLSKTVVVLHISARLK